MSVMNSNYLTITAFGIAAAIFLIFSLLFRITIVDLSNNISTIAKDGQKCQISYILHQNCYKCNFPKAIHIIVDSVRVYGNSKQEEENKTTIGILELSFVHMKRGITLSKDVQMSLIKKYPPPIKREQVHLNRMKASSSSIKLQHEAVWEKDLQTFMGSYSGNKQKLFYRRQSKLKSLKTNKPHNIHLESQNDNFDSHESNSNSHNGNFDSHDVLFYLISDYWPESLVLMKRKLNMTAADILCTFNDHEGQLSDDQNFVFLHKCDRISNIRYHKNVEQVFTEIDKGKDIYDEIENMRRMFQMKSKFCSDSRMMKLYYGKSPWNEPFYLTKDCC